MKFSLVLLPLSLSLSFPAINSTAGADEYLFNYRWQLPAGRVLDKPLSAGPERAVGPSLGGSKKTFMAGIGYEWWKNKYGTPAGVGTHTRTPTLNFEARF